MFWIDFKKSTYFPKRYSFRQWTNFEIKWFFKQEQTSNQIFSVNLDLFCREFTDYATPEWYRVLLTEPTWCGENELEIFWLEEPRIYLHLSNFPNLREFEFFFFLYFSKYLNFR